MTQVRSNKSIIKQMLKDYTIDLTAFMNYCGSENPKIGTQDLIQITPVAVFSSILTLCIPGRRPMSPGG